MRETVWWRRSHPLCPVAGGGQLPCLAGACALLYPASSADVWDVTCHVWQVTDLTCVRLCGGVDPIRLAVWRTVGGCLHVVWQAHARCRIPRRLLTCEMVLAYFGRWPISQA